MRLLILSLLVLVFTSCKGQNDPWSGTYRFIPSSKDSSNIDTSTVLLIIKLAADAKVDKIPSKEESDLKRWNIISGKDTVEVRRFLFDLENKENEYEEFGWTELHKKGKMECIDAGHFFICKTEPNTSVKFGKDSFFTKTGIFGIRLHYGLFELEKVKE